MNARQSSVLILLMTVSVGVGVGIREWLPSSPSYRATTLPGEIDGRGTQIVQDGRPAGTLPPGTRCYSDWDGECVIFVNVADPAPVRKISPGFCARATVVQRR